MFSQTKYEIGRVFGVPVKVDISLQLLAAVFIFSYLRSGGSLAASLVAGLLGTAALAAALLAHEVGHAAVAIGYGCRVREITLMFFGGSAAISNMPSAPLRRAAISFAGPAAGFALWFVAGLALPLAPSRALAFFVAETARLSLYLSVFNLIPAIPLDGGHILRAVLTHFRGVQYAQMVSQRVSSIVAVAMGIVGLLEFNPLLIMLAFFIWASAKRELLRMASGGDDPDGLDDDIVVISPPPYGKENEYTRIRRP